eukprot:404605-Rhodomonas_salina.1
MGGQDGAARSALLASLEPRSRAPMLLRACSRKSGTEREYAATRSSVLSERMLLRACYGKSGTERAYAASRRELAHLEAAMLLVGLADAYAVWYATPGTGIAYQPTRCAVLARRLVVSA